MDLSNLMPVFLITLVVFGLAIASMAVGVILSGRCLHGSCGGPELRARDGLSLRCLFCPYRRRRGDGPDESRGGGS
jgi:hypothetical protein